jgi:uncharacterized membrane protein
MEARAKLLGHPIDQMLIRFPFGLLATAVIFDIVYLIWGTTYSSPGHTAELYLNDTELQFRTP